MSNIAKLLKAEVQRIVRREIAQAVAAQKQGLSSVKKALAESRKRVDAVEKLMKSGLKAAQRSAAASQQDVEEADELRVTAKSLKSMRNRLGITQAELASLLGVSVQVVSVWETKKGSVHIRNSAVRTTLSELKQQKKAAVYERLGKEVKPKKGARARRGSASTAVGLVSGVDGAAIIKLRKRLGLSQHQFAALTGVSNQLVSVWERKQGALLLRAVNAQRLSEVMKLSKSEAKKRLG